MNIVITMAGLGSRFRKAGYTVPKYQIEVHGKTLFEWSMSSLTDFFALQNRYIFIVRKEDGARNFIESACRSLRISPIHIAELDAPTDGQATTTLYARDYWKEDDSLLIYNIDTYVEPYFMKAAEIQGDGFIPCFSAEGDHWSFVKLDEDGKAVEVREKKRISDHCTLGAYYFKTASLYVDLYNEYYADGHLEMSEKYVAPLYNLLIQKGGVVRISTVDSKAVHVLGTPEELAVFQRESMESAF